MKSILKSNNLNAHKMQGLKYMPYSGIITAYHV